PCGAAHIRERNSCARKPGQCTRTASFCTGRGAALTCETGARSPTGRRSGLVGAGGLGSRFVLELDMNSAAAIQAALVELQYDFLDRAFHALDAAFAVSDDRVRALADLVP